MYFRAVIFHLHKKGCSLKDIHEELRATYEDKAPSQSTVANWLRAFKKGRQTLANDKGTGRPKKELTEIVQKVEDLMRKDPKINVKQIAVELGVSRAQIHKLMKLNLLHYNRPNGEWVKIEGVIDAKVEDPTELKIDGST